MEKGTVVFVPCDFEPGGFPNERVFIIRRSETVEYRGVADVTYCYDENGEPLGLKPSPEPRCHGRVVGRIVRMTEWAPPSSTSPTMRFTRLK